MEPQNIRFGGGSAGTLLHPLVAVWMALAIVLILCLPRKYVMVPLLSAMFTIPIGQVVVLAGVHFTMARILVLTALLRMLCSGGKRLVGDFNSIDRTFVMWAVFLLTIFSLQWMETQALVTSLGNFLDAVGGYFVMRFLIRDEEDINRTIKTFVAICVMLGVCMLNEQLTGRNIFGLLGGMPIESAVREGKIRAQGAFEVYITAGVFAGALLPLFFWLWKSGRSKLMALAGFFGATLMTICSNSSTPLLAYMGGLVGLAFWPLRKRMRLFRWGLVITLLGLHLVMKAPVWSLIGRVDLTGSSSGYHRYMLVDNCIRHFSDWWLLGYKYYENWGWDMWDLSNQYVAYALTGGLATLVTFIMIISRSFGRLGDARKLIQARGGDKRQEWLVWCVGAALLAHVVAYFGIGYFDQIQFAWYALLAIVSATVAEVSSAQPAAVESSSISSVECPLDAPALEAVR